jgi:hypothetical protein
LDDYDHDWKLSIFLKTNVMKNPIFLPILFAACLFSACGPGGHHDDGTFTSLNGDQVNKLAPYMVDLKKVGDLQSSIDTLRISDSSSVIQHRNKQTFSFRIMTDGEGHPVKPDSTGTVARKAGGGWHNGEISTFCFGGCIMVNQQLCLVKACLPMDNACGCIAPVCGPCEVWDCSPEILGLISGSVVIQ